MADNKPDSEIAVATKAFLKKIDKIIVPEGRAKIELAHHFSPNELESGNGIILRALATFVAQDNYSGLNKKVVDRLNGKKPIYKTMEAVAEGNKFAPEFLVPALTLPQENIFSRLETAAIEIAKASARAVEERQNQKGGQRLDDENHLNDIDDPDRPKDAVVEASEQVAEEEVEAQEVQGKRGTQNWKNGPTAGPPVDNKYIKDTAGNPDKEFAQNEFEKLEANGGVFQNKFANIDDPATKNDEAQAYKDIAIQVSEAYAQTLGPVIDARNQQRNQGGRAVS